MDDKNQDSKEHSLKDLFKYYTQTCVLNLDVDQNTYSEFNSSDAKSFKAKNEDIKFTNIKIKHPLFDDYTYLKKTDLYVIEKMILYSIIKELKSEYLECSGGEKEIILSLMSEKARNVFECGIKLHNEDLELGMCVKHIDLEHHNIIGDINSIRNISENSDIERVSILATDVTSESDINNALYLSFKKLTSKGISVMKLPRNINADYIRSIIVLCKKIFLHMFIYYDVILGNRYLLLLRPTVKTNSKFISKFGNYIDYNRFNGDKDNIFVPISIRDDIRINAVEIDPNIGVGCISTFKPSIDVKKLTTLWNVYTQISTDIYNES